jgi:Tfp pilus assembly protein PilW
VELAVAMLLFTIASMTVAQIFLTVTRSTRQVAGEAETADELELAANRMTFELRQASVVYAGSTASQLTFCLDANHDRYCDQDERIVYAAGTETVSGRTGVVVRRSTLAQPATTLVIARGLQSSQIFSYALTPPTPGAITLTLTASAAATAAGARTVATTITPRNQ